MTQPSLGPMTFAYQARTSGGQSISGTIDAPDVDRARQNLSALQLQVDRLQPARRPLVAMPLNLADFEAFNLQLAQLTAAGLPVEQGLRLVAQEMRRGRLRSAIQRAVTQLEQGKTLAEAISDQRSHFPPLYSRVIDAGIRSGNLSGVLLNLGRHLALTRRLRAMLWQTFSYPLFVVIFLLAMLAFILRELLPSMFKTYSEFHVQLPPLTQLLIAESNALPTQVKVLVVILAIGLVVWISLRSTQAGRRMFERLTLSLPLIGPVLKRNLASRWCDVTGLAVDAGLDLPAAIELADDAIASPALSEDGNAMIAAVSSGQPINSVHRLKILPPIIPAAMELGSARSDLPHTLRAASQMYQQQAQQRMALIPSILTPALVVAMGVLVALVVLSIFLPLLSLFRVY
jgi:general secretion pathway protein F